MVSKGEEDKRVDSIKGMHKIANFKEVSSILTQPYSIKEGC